MLRLPKLNPGRRFFSQPGYKSPRAFLASNFEAHESDSAQSRSAIVAVTTPIRVASVAVAPASTPVSLASVFASRFTEPDTQTSTESLHVDGSSLAANTSEATESKIEFSVSDVEDVAPRVTSTIATTLRLRTLLLSSATPNTTYALKVGGLTLGTIVTDSQGDALLELQPIGSGEQAAVAAQIDVRDASNQDSVSVPDDDSVRDDGVGRGGNANIGFNEPDDRTTRSSSETNDLDNRINNLDDNPLARVLAITRLQ